MLSYTDIHEGISSFFFRNLFIVPAHTLLWTKNLMLSTVFLFYTLNADFLLFLCHYLTSKSFVNKFLKFQ